jgi:hypothetical protein
MNSRITPSFTKVKKLWNRLPHRMLTQWMAANPATTAAARWSTGTPGNTTAVYLPSAMAAMAVGATKPAVADTQPDRKPTDGW